MPNTAAHSARELPDYERLAADLEDHHPSELHGQLCGLLCLHQALSEQRWLRAAGAVTGDVQQDVLQQLLRATAAQFDEDEIVISLLLPDDAMNISVRAESLGYWCQGLLTGLGLGGLSTQDQLSGDVQEFLGDVSQIARVGLDGDSGDEDSERAYAEIVEYLRVGLALLKQELLERDGGPAAGTLH